MPRKAWWSRIVTSRYRNQTGCGRSEDHVPFSDFQICKCITLSAFGSPNTNGGFLSHEYLLNFICHPFIDGFFPRNKPSIYWDTLLWKPSHEGLGLTCARVFWLTCARARRPHLSTRFWSHARTRKTRC